MNARKKLRSLCGGSQGLLVLAWPEMVLIAAVTALVIFMIHACTRNIAGPSSLKFLKRQLLLLRNKMDDNKPVDPDQERQEMERLQNKIKTSCSGPDISGDDDLKLLIRNSCQSIRERLAQPGLPNRTGWIKFNQLMIGFKTSYFKA